MNIKMRYLAAIVASMLMAMSSAAPPGTMVGPGLVSCGQFLEDKEQLATLLDREYFAWAQGFLSAANAFVAHPKPYVDLSDIAGQKLWLENYCQQNPLDKFYVATVELWKDLAKRQGLSSDPPPQ